MVHYPASSLHPVEPVTRGCRTAAFFWIQSMVRDDSARRTLFDLASGVQAAAAAMGQGDPAVIRLTGVYHYLLRPWAARKSVVPGTSVPGRLDLGGRLIIKKKHT